MKKSMKKAEHEQIQLQKSSLKRQRHIVQLRTVYCMAKNGISALNFEPLMKLCFILICLNVSCLVNDHVYVIYVYNIIDIVQFYILFSVNRLNSNKTK